MYTPVCFIGGISLKLKRRKFDGLLIWMRQSLDWRWNM